MAFDLLSEPIRKFVRRKKWESLRPIQAAAITRILTTDCNYILASRTASGKTEAAFLPILSKADFNIKGVQVLYISPLIALINDQFVRIEELCEDLEISVTKWHGEANKTAKNNLLKNPNGVLLITPESLEAMFVNAPYNAANLFKNLHYIVVDEIHSFLGVDRGIQLKSIISRIQQLQEQPRVVKIGLSATIGEANYPEAKRLLGSEEDTKVLLDKTKKETIAAFSFFESDAIELPLELMQNIYKQTSSNKALIFPNSRGKTEEIAVKLMKIAERVNGHKNYFTHHSSVDKEIREGIEKFAKENQKFNFCIVCTSTLELGIDIGTVDKIVQVDSTNSVSSLVQRVGRSGRRDNESSVLNLYATDKWSLLQSLACWNLYKKDFLEPIQSIKKPYDILLHQVLSIIKQLSGCSKSELIERIQSNPTFVNIDEQQTSDLIDWLLKKEILEKIGSELIIGVDGEYIVNSREFYSVFTTEPDFKVIHSGNKIGSIPYSPQIQINENILLAASIWKIIDIDFDSSKILVRPARDGKKPKFFGGAGNVHHQVREEMLKIITSTDDYEELDLPSKSAIRELRFDFSNLNIQDYTFDRPVILENESRLKIFTFTGTSINHSLSFLFKSLGYEFILSDRSSSFKIKTNDLESLMRNLSKSFNSIDEFLVKEIEGNEAPINFTKWGKYLPIHYQVEVLKERYFDFEKAKEFIETTKFILIK